MIPGLSLSDTGLGSLTVGEKQNPEDIWPQGPEIEIPVISSLILDYTYEDMWPTRDSK